MDVITYVDNLLAFREEAKALAIEGIVPDLSYNEETDSLVYGVDKTPVHYNGNESITLIRIDSDRDLDHFSHMSRLGECINGQYVFDSANTQETYERVYSTDPYTVEMDEESLTVVPPYMIGVFS